MNESTLTEEGVRREGVQAAPRSAGYAALAAIEAVILETDVA